MSDRPYRALLSRVAVLLFLGLGLSLGLLALLDIYTGMDLAAILLSPWLVPALLLQAAAILLFIAAWYALLRRQSPTPFSFADCSAHIGITLTSKYIPGKIWGLLGRGFLMERAGLTRARVVALLLVDQLLTFHSGLLLAAAALLGYWLPLAGLALLLLGLALTPRLLRAASAALMWLAGKSRRLWRRLGPEPGAAPQSLRYDGLQAALWAYLLHWLLTVASLWLLFAPALAEAPLANALLLVAAIPAGLLSGFLALWAPGGVGVREAVIIGLLAINLPLELAGAIAVTYRLFCVLNDLGTGLFAALYLQGRAPALLDGSAEDASGGGTEEQLR